MVRDMEIPFQNNKVYVAVSEDVDDGFLTLDWALRKWSTQSIVVVILYAANNICKDYVYTPLGKFPASSVSEKKLKDLEQNEEAKTQRILSKYMAFCDKVKTEILRIEKHNEPVQKIIVDLISGIRITNLVMSLKFMRPVCWKSRGAISGLFYLHRQKPGFCELFIICGGKLVFLREENNEGLARSREKRSTFRSYVGKMFNEASAKWKKPCDSPLSSPSSSTSGHQWEKYKEEIELYFTQLSSNTEASGSEAADEHFQKLANMTREEKRAKIQEIQQVIQQIGKEAKANPARLARAKWAMSLCSSRAAELGGCINEEIAKRAQLEKEFCSTKEELNKLQTETEEKRAMLNSILQLQDQLSSKLHLLSQEMSQAGLQVEEETRAQAAVVQEAAKLRRQRDVFLRRIEFSKQKDAIGLVKQNFDYTQFTAAEIRAATDDLSERLRLKSGGDWTNVYKGCLNSTLVAVKIYNNSGIGDSEEAFQAKVKLFGSIRHPNLLSMIGFCSELKCIVFEYMPNGCLRDILFSTYRTSKRRYRSLNWLTRIHIAAEVSTGLSFLHEAKPRPMVHGRLNPSRILLDRNNVAKFGGLMPSMCYDASEISSDIRAFGNLILQLLSGRNWGGLVEEAIMMDHQTALINVLDHKAGDWPLDLAVELGGIAVKCLTNHENQGQDLSMAMVARDMDKVKKKGDEVVRSAEFAVANEDEAADSEVEEDAEIPSAFLCPIFQDIMQDPHIAADGFSYEVEAIGVWLRSGHDTSPITNLKLKHTLLTPNLVLRSLIHDWRKKRSHLPSMTVH